MLCLDEATSGTCIVNCTTPGSYHYYASDRDVLIALDAVSELRVNEAIEKILESRHTTSLIVAHRLSTISRAERIVVLEGTQSVQTLYCVSFFLFFLSFLSFFPSGLHNYKYSLPYLYRPLHNRRRYYGGGPIQFIGTGFGFLLDSRELTNHVFHPPMRACFLGFSFLF